MIIMITEATFAAQGKLKVNGRTRFVAESRERWQMIHGQNQMTLNDDEKDVFEIARAEFFELTTGSGK